MCMLLKLGNNWNYVFVVKVGGIVFVIESSCFSFNGK